MFISNKLEIPTNSLSCFIGRIDELDENFEKTGIMWVDFDNLDGSGEIKKHGENGSKIQKVTASWTIRSAYAAWINPPVLKYKGRLNLNGKMSIDEMEFECKECNIKGTGRVTLQNATMSTVNLSGGAPMPPVPAVCGPFPGTAGPIPPVLSGAAGNAVKIEAPGPMGEIDFNTSNATIKFNSKVTFKVNDNKAHFGVHTANSGLDGYDIELKLDRASIMPWCTDVRDIDSESGKDQNPGDGDDMSSEDTQAKARERTDFIKTGKNGDFALCIAIGNSMNNLYCIDLFI